MAFRGWFALNGEEFSNSSRVLAHMVPGVPTSDAGVVTPMQCSCDITLPYDDSWPGLEDALDNGPYLIDDAPWIDVNRPESREFAGVWMMDVQGLDAVPISREVSESICAGGVPSRARDTSRTVTFSALILACSNAGAEFGKNWLSCVLRQSNDRHGVDLAFYKAHPSGTSADPDSLRRTAFGTVLTKSMTVTDFAGKGGSSRHRQASIYRVEWEMVLTNPYLYGPAEVQAVAWDTTEEESITWAHAPDCEDTGGCDLPTIFNADCPLPEIPLIQSEPPTCGGCLPLCSIERRTWELTSIPGSCEETSINVRVTNSGETPLTVNFYWQPCGNTDKCDRVYPLQVSGLPAGMTVVADSITGRPYIDAGGTRQRQVGIVSTTTGAPWQPTLLDSTFCWELVAESAPGEEYTVVIEMRDRDA